MNLHLAREILRAVEAQPGGCLTLRGRKMRQEARRMQAAGWLELTQAPRTRAPIVARVTESGHQVSQLFETEAVAQRLREAFMPRR